MELIPQQCSPTVCLSQPIAQLTAEPTGSNDIIAGQWHHSFRACFFLLVCLAVGDKEECVYVFKRELKLTSRGLQPLCVIKHFSFFLSLDRILLSVHHITFFFLPFHLSSFFPVFSFFYPLAHLLMSLFHSLIINYIIINSFCVCLCVKLQGQSIGLCVYCDLAEFMCMHTDAVGKRMPQ